MNPSHVPERSTQGEYDDRTPPEGADHPAVLEETSSMAIPSDDSAAREGDESLPAQPLPVLPPSLDRYRIVRLLGQGGMGAVYLARDTQLDRLVALKVPQLSQESTSRHLPHVSPALRERFLREARAAALLHHPHICPVYDVGIADEVPYLTMAYIEGSTLGAWAKAQKPTPEQSAMLLVTLAYALEEAHRQGLVHRDLKPSNVMINQRGEPVVMDFGLAWRQQWEGPRLTRPGVLMGTPAYMAPEQILHDTDAVGPATDIYSLGVMLYELLTGQLPFQGPVGAVLARAVSEEPTPPTRVRSDLDPRFDLICLRALNKDPRQRFESMAAFAETLVLCTRPAPSHTASNSATFCQPLPPLPGGLDHSTKDETAQPGRESGEGHGDTPRREREPTTSGSASPSSVPVLDHHLAPEILRMLRSRGLAITRQRLRTRVRKETRRGRRAALQAYLDCVCETTYPEAASASALEQVEEGTPLVGWALVGRASLALRDRDYPRTHALLDRALSRGTEKDQALQATIAHVRGASWVHQGQAQRALPELHQALTLFGPEHFVAGRVLDTLGMAHACLGHFQMAREFYEHSLHHKEARGDDSGVAVTHGQLGRLHLDWGGLDQAERHFQEDLRLAQKARSLFSEAQMCNHLGQVALARGERESTLGRKATARRCWREAEGWLGESIRLSQEGSYPIAEGYARKDRALLQLARGQVNEAEEEALQAFRIFQNARFPEGLAQTDRALGIILREQERYDESLRRLRDAVAHFEESQERDQVARTQLELARTLRASETVAPMVTRAYCEALEAAETCRFASLVQEIEEDLREVDPEAYLEHIYRRVRGESIDEDVPSLGGGSLEMVSVLSLDLPDFATFTQGRDPDTVFRTFNHLLTDLGGVLASEGVRVLCYHGQGFTAIARGARHAERAVNAAQEAANTLADFNHPRQVLGLPLLQARMVVHSGNAFVGNVGTYDKMDLAVLGITAGLSLELLRTTAPGTPCISKATRDLASGYGPGKRSSTTPLLAGQLEGPRMVSLAGWGEVEVWDVVGVKGPAEG